MIKSWIINKAGRCPSPSLPYSRWQECRHDGQSWSNHFGTSQWKLQAENSKDKQEPRSWPYTDPFTLGSTSLIRYRFRRKTFFFPKNHKTQIKKLNNLLFQIHFLYLSLNLQKVIYLKNKKRHMNIYSQLCMWNKNINRRILTADINRNKCENINANFKDFLNSQLSILYSSTLNWPKTSLIIESAPKMYSNFFLKKR